jgi:hypothetical protein
MKFLLAQMLQYRLVSTTGVSEGEPSFRCAACLGIASRRQQLSSPREQHERRRLARRAPDRRARQDSVRSEEETAKAFTEACVARMGTLRAGPVAIQATGARIGERKGDQANLYGVLQLSVFCACVLEALLIQNDSFA